MFLGRAMFLVRHHNMGNTVGCATHTLLVGWNLRLCFLTRWCFWLDSVFRQAYKVGSYGQVESQAGLCNQVGH